MKKLFFIALIIAFSGVASAQDRTNTASDMSKKQTNSEMNVSSDVQNKIKEQLFINEELGQKAINYLKSDPNSVRSLNKIYEDSNGNVKHIMNAVINDAKLLNVVMNWINTDPTVNQQVMKLIGM